ncbi:MAG: S-layer homology domain-containing protein [Capsulimonadaceae bacterium]
MIGKIATVLLTAATAVVLAAGAVYAQGSTVFPDVPQNHWAYQEVHDLADKGLVKGYLNGQFLGSRAMTRYEFATVIDRLLQTISDMKAGTTPTTGVTQDDLDKIQVLVDKFQPELDAIQADVSKAKSDIDDLRQNVAELRQDAQDTKALANQAENTANQALATANRSYGTSLSRKF